MSLRWRQPELRRRARGWLISAALFALMPKCVLCLAAYLGVGAALGLTGPELCGASAGPSPTWIWPALVAGLALGAIAWRRSAKRSSEE